MSTEIEEEPHVRPWWAPIPLVAFVVLVICGYVGTAVAPTWANDRPAMLILLHSRIRHLLLALGGDVDLASYAVIATARLSLAYAVCHMIGRAFGPAILDLFVRYLGVTRQQIATLDDGIRRLEWALIPVFVGSNIMATITGIQRLPFRRLAPYVLVGIAGRLVLVWWVARLFDDELDTVLDIFNRYRWPALIISVGLVLATIAFNLSRGRNA